MYFQNEIMTAAVQLPSANMEEALKVLAEGLPVHRVKRSKLVQPASIFIDQNQNINFSTIRRPFFGCFSKKVKRGWLFWSCGSFDFAFIIYF